MNPTHNQPCQRCEKVVRPNELYEFEGQPGLTCLPCIWELQAAARPDLKRCPFCGSAPEWQFGGPNSYAVFIRCDGCHVTTEQSSGYDKEAVHKVAALWNRRA